MYNPRPFTRLWLLLVFFCVCPTMAQDDVDTPAPAEKAANYSPRDTVKRMLTAISEQSEEALATHFDTRPSRTLRGVNARQVMTNFPAILDKYGSLTPIGLLSDDENGSVERDLSSAQESVGQVRFEDRTFAIVLEKVEDKTGGYRWLVSQQTILSLSDISQNVQTSRINIWLPTSLIENTWRGAPIGQWVSMPVLLLMSVAIGWLLAFFIRKVASHYASSKKGAALLALAIPSGIVAAVAVFLLLERYLGISILIRQDFGVLTVSALWVAVFIFLWVLLDSLSALGEKTLRKKNRLAGLSLMVFFRASAKTVLLILAVILVLDSNGVDVTTGLAALGIGGIALALGAQKAIENIVGSVVIVVDQPFRVGDFCKIGDMQGTVEKIGLRSTRIRTLMDTVVTYPNGALSTERIENYTMRRKFLLKTVLNLRYETHTQNLENLLAELREALKASEHVSKEGFRVQFIGYGATSLDVEVFLYVFADNYNVFLARQEGILLSMSKIVESNGSGFAFPSQTVYLTKDAQKHHR